MCGGHLPWKGHLFIRYESVVAGVYVVRVTMSERTKERKEIKKITYIFLTTMYHGTSAILSL